jgi:hypothetical protein
MSSARSKAGSAGVSRPVGDELAEQPLVAGYAGDFAVVEGGDRAGERVPPAREVAFVEVVQQHQADRV